MDNRFNSNPFRAADAYTRRFELCCLAGVGYTCRLFNGDGMLLRGPQPNRSALKWADTTVYGTMCHREIADVHT